MLGVVLHAAITYMHRPMDGLLWPLREQPTNKAFDLLFWWIHGWRIPIFFVIAGFFAAMLVRRRGASGFIKHRIKRIVIPLAWASVMVLPMMYVVWAWGWVDEGRATWREVWRTSFDDGKIDEGMLGVAHLWFLYYLAIFSFVYWALLRVRKCAEPGEVEPGPLVRALFGSAFAPLILAAPTACVIAKYPGFYLSYKHLIPRTGGQAAFELLQLAYQGYFFIVGVYLFRMHRQVQVLTRWTGTYLVGAHLAFGSTMVLAWRYFAHLDHRAPFSGIERAALAISVALFCWLMIWGMLGLGLSVLSKNRAWVRWLSDSAYWVYLIHLPVVGLLMLAVRNSPQSPVLKFMIVMLGAGLFSLLSYRYLVRYTFIGNALNGPRHRSGQTTQTKTN